MKLLLPLLIAAVLCAGAGCATTITTQQAPGIDLRQFHRIFVETPLNENHHIDELLADELRAAGFEATSEPLTMMPENTDAILTYGTRWSGDFKIDLMDLNLSLHTAHTRKLLAEARYYQPSITTKSPEKVVHIVVDRLFKPSK